MEVFVKFFVRELVIFSLELMFQFLFCWFIWCYQRRKRHNMICLKFQRCRYFKFGWWWLWRLWNVFHISELFLKVLTSFWHQKLNFCYYSLCSLFILQINSSLSSLLSIFDFTVFGFRFFLLGACCLWRRRFCLKSFSRNCLWFSFWRSTPIACCFTCKATTNDFFKVLFIFNKFMIRNNFRYFWVFPLFF